MLQVPTLDSILATLPELICPGDTILVKASHAMHFEKVVEKLLEKKYNEIDEICQKGHQLLT